VLSVTAGQARKSVAPANKMYKEEVYRSISREFCTGVGVATTFRVTEVVRDPQVERSREDRIRYRIAQDEWRINRVIAEAVARGRYPQLTRRVWALRGTHSDWSERKIYVTAWGDVTGRKKRTKTKPKHEHGAV